MVKEALFSRKRLADVYLQANASFEKAVDFEEVDPNIGDGLNPRAKVIAFYLPQFHEVHENNKNWGAGFTEWTNLSRNIPRFPGHIAPRTPRDLGFYNLLHGDIQIRQAEMAKNAGLFGFCYYYYRFDSKGFMDAPLKRMLNDPRVDFPFCLMWCNESWTRAWVGKERTTIAEQKYSNDLDVAFADETAKIFADPRYIRFENRPLLVVYRPTFIPNSLAWFSGMKRLYQDRHAVDPIIALAETDACDNLSAFQPEAAVEFVANKYTRRLRLERDWSDLYAGRGAPVSSYDHLVELSLADPSRPYPIARSILTDWDKNPRRPGRGRVIHGSSPAKFERWANAIIDSAQKNLFFGESVVFVSAWNEWAESAYLEPDTHRGGAFLNSLGRAVFR